MTLNIVSRALSLLVFPRCEGRAIEQSSIGAESFQAERNPLDCGVAVQPTSEPLRVSPPTLRGEFVFPEMNS